MRRLARLGVACLMSLGVLGAARAGAAPEPVPARLPVPGVAAAPADFAPPGFVLEREVAGETDTGATTAQVYADADGRRALLIGARRADGFEATGWGFVLPCQRCGIDLPAADNLELAFRRGGLAIVDRSAARREGTTTRAELLLRYDPAVRQWRLALLTQLTVFLADGRAERSVVDYQRGEARDATGRFDGTVFFAEREERSRVEGGAPPLDALTLY